MNYIFSKIIKNYLALLLVLGSSALCYAQSDNIIRQKNKFGLTIALDEVTFSNTPNASIFYNRDDRTVASVGLKYNFKQIKTLPNANISIGLKIRHLTYQTEFRINADDLDLSTDLINILQDAPYWTYHLPVQLDYVLQSRKNREIYLTGGFELQLYGVTEGSETFDMLTVRSVPIIINTVKEHSNPLTYGLNIGAGFNFYTNRGSMYQLSLQYHYHFQTMERSTITVTNLQFSPDATSSHNWRNNSLGINFTYFPSFKFNRRND